MAKGFKLAIVGYALAVLGALVKLYGAVAGNSKSLLVDGLTCVANLAAGLAALKLTVEAERPPDADHPYGHARFAAVGAMAVLMIYSFVAGLALSSLLSLEPYEVSVTAPAAAILGLALYGAAIAVLRRGGPALRAYAALSVTELVESAVTVTATVAGLSLGFVADYVGGVLLFAYLVYELQSEFRRVALLVTDYAPPELVERLHELARSLGLRVCGLRVRMVAPGRYFGDAIVAGNTLDLREAHALADRLEREAESLGVHLVVHYEPAGCGEG